MGSGTRGVAAGSQGNGVQSSTTEVTFAVLDSHTERVVSHEEDKTVPRALAWTGPDLESPEKIQRFKELLLDLSAGLIRVPPFNLTQEIDNALQVMGRFWDFDWVLLGQLSDDGSDLGVVHSYADRSAYVPLVRALVKEIPWFMERMRSGEAVCLDSIPDDLPADATKDRHFCAAHGIASALSLPLKVGDNLQGAVSFVSLHKRHIWTEKEKEVLHCAGEILASALERKKAAERINELITFEQLLSDVSARYINLPVDQIESSLRNDFGRMSETLGVDRCVLYLASEENGIFRMMRPFFWCPNEDVESIKLLDEWTAQHPNFVADNFRYFFDKWSKGEIIRLTRLEELPREAKKVKEIYRRYGVKSALSIPISAAGSTVGALVLSTTRAHRHWPDELIPRLRLFAEIFGNALVRKRSEEALQGALSEIRQLKERIEADYLYLSEEIKLEHNFDEIVGKSQALTQILLKAKQVAPTNATVLLLGETGTGKGLIARTIHNASKRRGRPLVQVNCAALTPTLIESELFGHEKGAFTGAATKRVGRFELSNGTTLFLDEVGDLPLELQPKLLRVLQDGEFERVGGSSTIKTDVRVIAATNRNLEKEVEEGRFRRDLWYRLNIFPIAVPPLRERLDDIPLFVQWFVRKYGKWSGRKFEMVSQKTIRALQNYSWPGNIRELENVVERAVITSPNDALHVEVPLAKCAVSDRGKTLADIEREHILKVLEDADWKIEGPRGAARRLGLNPSTLRFRMQKLVISRPPSVK